MNPPKELLRRVKKGYRAHSGAKRMREKLFKKQKGKCFYCGYRMRKAKGKGNSVTLEHRTPLSRGGSHAHKNLAAACYTCNTRKRSMLESEFLLTLERSKDGSSAINGVFVGKRETIVVTELDKLYRERLLKYFAEASHATRE